MELASDWPGLTQITKSWENIAILKQKCQNQCFPKLFQLFLAKNSQIDVLSQLFQLFLIKNKEIAVFSQLFQLFQ